MSGKEKKVEMTLEEFQKTEILPLLQIFDFSSNIPMSIYLDSTGIKLPEACYRSALISQTRFFSEEYLLNSKRSSIDMGLSYGVFGYTAFGVRGSLAQRYLIEEEEHDKENNIIKLPPYKNINAPLGSVLRSRRSIRKMTEKTMSLQELSTILFYGDGATGEFNLIDEEKEMLPVNTLGSKYVNTLRTAPSGGGLYPIYLYIIVQNVDGLKNGVYLYMPLSHSLKIIRIFDIEDYQKLSTIAEWGLNLDSSKINMMIFYVYNLYENSRKYGDMGLTLALIEAGEISENIHLICTAQNIALCDIGGYEKVQCERFIGIDGLTKHIIHLTVIGR